MSWYQWLSLAALGFCLVMCLYHLFRLIRLGNPADYARPSGNTSAAVAYAFTGAMSPARKESAFLHLPTYSAGLLYHTGNFLSFILFFFILFDVKPDGWMAWGLVSFLLITAFSGAGIMVKRMMKKELRSLSNPDDFISNILVTIFQTSTLLYILPLTVLPSYSLNLFYYLSFSLLALYIPAGKLRHLVYFFAARYHLGRFFGWRGVWPPEHTHNRVI